MWHVMQMSFNDIYCNNWDIEYTLRIKNNISKIPSSIKQLRYDTK